MQRMMLLRLVLLACTLTLVGRLYQLQLVESDFWHYGMTVEQNTTRYVMIAPRRGEIFARDGKTLLAESVPVFSVAVQTGHLPPAESHQRAIVLGTLAQLTGITGTLTLSPTTALRDNVALAHDLESIIDATVLQRVTAQHTQPGIPHTFTIIPALTLQTLTVVQHYPNYLTFNNPIDTLIATSNTRHYQSIIVHDAIPEEMAVAIAENSHYLPGVVIEKSYQRRYPMSGQLTTFSHFLGYIGRINACELVTENSATSWVESLTDSLSNVAGCGLLPKKVDTTSIGVPQYQHTDYIGKDGLEASYEQTLRGSLGIQTVLVDALERPISNNRTIKPVQDGSNLILTIDANFQQETERILRRWLAEADVRRLAAHDDYKHKYKPIKSGVIIAMNPTNGDVLSMVSLPSYDNNVWVNPAMNEQLANLLNPPDPAQREELQRLSPLTNRALAGQYSPGSSFKQFIAAIALQKHIIDQNTTLRDPGKIVLQERNGSIFTLPNSDPRDNGNITLSDALKVSSNVFFASIAGGNEQAINLDDNDRRIEGLGITGMSEGLQWFRFGMPTQVRLPGEPAGHVPDPVWKARVLREPWTIGDTYNTAIGQGYVEVTPLQLVTYAAAVANNGTIYQPTIVHEIVNNNGDVVQEITPTILSTVPVNAEHFALIQDGMRRSVTEGLNVFARDECSGLTIAGKTGTAEYGSLIEKGDGSYARRSHAWFVGYAPYDNPQIIVVALLEGAGDMNDGSSTLAVPAVTQVLQAYFGVQRPADAPAECPAIPPDADARNDIPLPPPTTQPDVVPPDE